MATDKTPKAPPTEKPPKAPKVTKGPGRPAGGVKRAQCDAIATLISLPIGVISPPDALQPNEVAALGIALYDAAQANAYIATIIGNLTSVGGLGELGMVTAAIVGRRVLSRMVDMENIDPRLVGLGVVCEQVINNVVTGPARSSSGLNGQRENDTSPRASNHETVQNNSVDQTRPAGVASVEGSETWLPS